MLAFAIAVLALTAVRTGLAVFRPARLPQWVDPDTRAAPHRFRIEPVDVLLGLAFTGAQYWVLDLYRDFYNPENQAIGHDNYAFLSTGVAAASGRWDLYMVDKRPLYGILIAILRPLFGNDLIHAAVGINMAAMSLTQLPMVLLGRFWGGRAAGAAAGMMLFGCVLFYPYAHEISSYPLYLLVSTTVVLMVSIALVRPGWKTALWAGTAMALLTLTQVKNFTFNVPMVGLLGLGILIDGHRDRLRRSLCIAAPIAAAVTVLSAYPVEFTPLNVLVMHHREEVNYEIPYEWDEVLTPDVRNPSPLSGWLPDGLRGGELEAATGVMMTPPNSNVVAAFPQDGPKPRWEVVRATTIPPLSKRLEHNIKQASILAPGLGTVLLPLTMLGWLWTVLVPTARVERRLKIPSGWWKAGVLLVPLASCFGSLSLKFNLRYVFHAAPTVFVLIACAAAGAAALFCRRGGSGWQGLFGLATVGLGISVGVSLFIRAPLMAGPLDKTTLSQAFFRLPPDSRQLMGKGYRLVGQYLEEHLETDARIYDCTPIAMGLYRPEDARLIRPKNGSERDKLCAKQLKTESADGPRYLVLTSIPEFFGPDAVTPAHATRAGWSLLYGYDMNAPRELIGDESNAGIGPGWLAVYTDTPRAELSGHSMLNGASPSTTALTADSPTQPNRRSGAPEAGNP
jgi:4-amino-4-deoxy-L-arabinose transferase-like glycosyltransferase